MSVIESLKKSDRRRRRTIATNLKPVQINTLTLTVAYHGDQCFREFGQVYGHRENSYYGSHEK
jgi:hypothetical protein